MKSFILSSVKKITKRLLTAIASLLGIKFLTENETIAYLSPHQQACYPANKISLPEVANLATSGKLIFNSVEAIAAPSYVWVYKPDVPKISLLRSGNIKTNTQILCTDHGNEHILKDSLKWNRRPVRRSKLLIAPFGHYQDGIVFGGYYDFIYLIAAKLCRIENAFPDSILTDSVVSYPLFNKPYEQEFLTYMGFKQEQILDSRKHNVKFDTCLLGNAGSWFYRNDSDVRAVQKRLAPLIQNPDNKRERIYVSRSGRRRVVNEDALVKLLETYDFTVIEDKPRTLSEQLSIYNRASFIIGPHGASFSNIIWCQPGTHLLELFSPSYVPDFFLYLAQLTGMNYSAYCQGPKQYRPARVTANELTEDVYVSLSDIERSLNKMLGGKPVLES